MVQDFVDNLITKAGENLSPQSTIHSFYDPNCPLGHGWIETDGIMVSNSSTWSESGDDVEQLNDLAKRYFDKRI